LLQRERSIDHAKKAGFVQTQMILARLAGGVFKGACQIGARHLLLSIGRLNGDFEIGYRLAVLIDDSGVQSNGWRRTESGERCNDHKHGSACGQSGLSFSHTRYIKQRSPPIMRGEVFSIGSILKCAPESHRAGSESIS